MKQLFILSLLALIFLSCSQQVAGFGSETTNGGTGVVVSLTGVTNYKSTVVQVIPSDFNPVTGEKTEIVNNAVDSVGNVRVFVESGKSYSIYGVDSISGKKIMIQNVVVYKDTTIFGELTPTGTLQVNFIHSEPMLDTINGVIFFKGYPEYRSLQSNLIRTDSSISVIFDSLPQSVLTTLQYAVKDNSEISHIVGDSISIVSDSVTEVDTRLYYRFLTISDSPLLSDTVTVVTIGKEPGLVWIGTNRGITRYKNNTFVSRTTIDSPLLNDCITAICESSDSVTWVGTQNGVGRVASLFTNITAESSTLLPSNSITALASTRNGSVWIGTNAGLTHLTSTETRLYTPFDGLPSYNITALAIDSSGTLWGGTDKGIFSISVDNIVTTYLESMGSTFFTIQPYVNDIAVSPSGDIWVGTCGDGLIVIADGIFTIQKYQENLSILNWVTVVQSDSEGNIWFGTKTVSLIKYDGTEWYCYLSENGSFLPNAEILSLVVDTYQNIYCGTLGKGLFLLGPNAHTLLYGE